MVRYPQYRQYRAAAQERRQASQRVVQLGDTVGHRIERHHQPRHCKRKRSIDQRSSCVACSPRTRKPSLSRTNVSIDCIGFPGGLGGRCYTSRMFAAQHPSDDKPQQYAQLAEQARALLAGEPDRIANAANLSALVYHAVPDLNWAGFYLYNGAELVVGPFQGLPACVRIPLDKGVCGAAASTRTTQRVADVHAFPGHIACDSASRSELVVPLVQGDRLIGVFDLDSPTRDRFDADDQRGLETIAAIYVESLA